MQGLKFFGFESASDLKALLIAPVKGVAAAPSLLNWLQVSEGATHQRENDTRYTPSPNHRNCIARKLVISECSTQIIAYSASNYL
jgi:hypothetical protein